MLQRTGRIASSAELREVLGVQRLASGAITVVGGEWRREGARWRFWRTSDSRERGEGQPAAPAGRQWWQDI